MMKHLLVFAILLLSFTAGCKDDSNKEDTTTLSFNFQPGSAYTYSMDSRQTIEQEMSGKTSVVQQTMQMLSTYGVEKANGTNKQVTVVYDRFYIKSASDGSALEYDSADSTRQPKELSHIANIVNRPFSLVVNEKGEILSVDPNAHGDRRVETDRRDPAAADQPLSDTTIRRMMEQSLNIYPSAPVRPGDTWKRKYITSMGFMDMEVSNEYKLVSIKDGIAHIEITAAIRTIPSDKLEQIEMVTEMGGSQKGTINMDVKTGLITDSRFSQNIIGKMKMSGFEIPMKLTSETRIIGKMK